MFFCLFCAVTLISCSKDNQSEPKADRKILAGSWELRAYSGGISTTYNPDNYKPGNGSIWAFSSNRFTRFYKGSVDKKGTYLVSSGTGTDMNTGRKIDQFIFNTIPAETFELKNDTLKFYFGMIAADGGIAMFVKTSNDTTSVKQ